jgi:predicted XRE-type DNA-binding protein
MKKNIDVRNFIEQTGVKYWEVAEKLGITDGNFSRKLRKELPTKEKELITNIALELKNKKDGGEEK